MNRWIFPKTFSISPAKFQYSMNLLVPVFLTICCVFEVYDWCPLYLSLCIHEPHLHIPVPRPLAHLTNRAPTNPWDSDYEMPQHNSPNVYLILREELKLSHDPELYNLFRMQHWVEHIVPHISFLIPARSHVSFTRNTTWGVNVWGASYPYTAKDPTGSCNQPKRLSLHTWCSIEPLPSAQWLLAYHWGYSCFCLYRFPSWYPYTSFPRWCRFDNGHHVRATGRHLPYPNAQLRGSCTRPSTCTRLLHKLLHTHGLVSICGRNARAYA